MKLTDAHNTQHKHTQHTTHNTQHTQHTTHNTQHTTHTHNRPDAAAGAGPIGCELAQAFARFGSNVHLFARSGRVLNKEEHDASAAVEEALQADGVTLTLNVQSYSSITCDDSGVHVSFVRKSAPEKQETLTFTHVLVAAGRRPNVRCAGLTCLWSHAFLHVEGGGARGCDSAVD